ncbi:HD-GYP domain-containing protein [Methylobacterium haplocladii]|uniref:Phosphohydrolase n=1 Tax=Methylobacterium haplocladii TaxID=1176176 RepID=A0A512ITP6_9HYPH|nr:HD domain-containing phosphohydrolase [Methylobacterium haplocladii]GEP01077.1 phosphohydrolase [Methylobacterium haplocladii]GJD85618.1 Ribonuclease Y [Methylobacterium haplocladii]GLS61196.1 phosphohydrolase [Methylobacterium haplocladii]
MQEPCVLLVSDRRERADRLASAIGLIRPCQVIEPGRRLPAGPPLAFLVDLADGLPDSTWGETLTRRTRTEAVPCLYVARGGEGPDGIRRFGAPTVIPAGSRSAGIVSILLKLLDEAGAAGATCARLSARVATATSLVTGLFDAAAAGRSPSAAEAEEGTEIVLAAVSEAGIQAWLDRLRQHHIGIYQHSLSVAGFAAAFAGELGLGRRDRRRLAQAALLHDIGKAHTPAAILDKPGPLTPDEMLVMRAHPTIGADLLAQDGAYDAAIIDVVRHHHERLDGSGYPDGLKGDAIGDLVRLVAICDVHSALTERRAYRAALSGPDARRIMDGMAGQLDADLLRAYAPVVLRAEGSIATTQGHVLAGS